ncbi:MAG: type transport system permease protein, partial [Actinomycetota bacterium]|nr:type transport system permease protein [Actinomycetota bacterium]
MSATTAANAVPRPRIVVAPTRSAAAASRLAFRALILRDLLVLRKNLGEFVTRTVIQPFLLVFVFLYVFPTIGQGVGGAGKAAQSAFATVLVPGVVGVTIMFQGIQAVAIQLSQEFGFTREIEDRVQAPLPISLVAVAKVISGAVQGVIAAVLVLPIAAVVHAQGVHAHLTIHWWIVLTLLPIACVAMTSLG